MPLSPSPRYGYTTRDILGLAVLLLVGFALTAGGRRSILARVGYVRDPSAEVNPGLREHVAAYGRRIDPGARIERLEVERLRPEVWLDGPYRKKTFHVHVRYVVADTAQCRYLIVRWNDLPATETYSPWHSNRQPGWVRDCAGRKLWRTIDFARGP